MMLKAAIIGCGAIAQVHKKVLRSITEAELTACCDIDPARLEAFAGPERLRAYSSAEALLEGEHPDVVHLCVPHPLHTPLAVLAAACGAHVFTEKPPAVDKAQWRQFQALENSGRRVGICFQNRYNQSVRSARELLASGRVGKVRGARAFLTWYRDASYYRDSGWRGSWQTEGGGLLINQAVHTLDLLTCLMGTPDGVECHMSNHSLRDVIEVEDTLEARIRFRSGAHALFYASNAYCDNAPVLLEVACDGATLRLEGDTLAVIWADGHREQMDSGVTAPLGKEYWGNSHFACIQDFYRAVLENRPYQNDIDSVRDTMELLLDMYVPFCGRRIGPLGKY